jgi:hypothetical protein
VADPRLNAEQRADALKLQAEIERSPRRGSAARFTTKDTKDTKGQS